MKTLYNLDETPSAEPSLKRNIMPDAKRSDNFTSLPWRAQSDSLWGHKGFRVIHKKVGAALKPSVKGIENYLKIESQSS
jgi:hypothetical protein